MKLKILVSIVALLMMTASCSDVWNSISRSMEFQKKKFQSLINPKEMMDQMTAFYNLVTQNEAYRKEQRKKHEKHGSLRSGEREFQLLQERLEREKEEQDRILELLNSKELVGTKRLHQQLFQKQAELIQEKVSGSKLLPGHTLSLVSTGRTLAATDVPEIEINYLYEPYPLDRCYHEGQLINQTQRYYMCQQKFGDFFEFRTDSVTFNLLRSSYGDYYNCSEQLVEKRVCACAPGYLDYLCQTRAQQECYLNITNPPFYQTCNYPDSPYYMYSIHGYDPCYFIDFTQSFELSFKLLCRDVDSTGKLQSTLPSVGYDYEDVVSVDEMPSFDLDYIKYQLKQEEGESMYVYVDLRDMKWLSHYARYWVEVTDPEVLNGDSEGSLTIDFPDVMEADRNGSSYYVVGGRAYFEGNTYQSGQINSYTYKGFFDQEGYVEPTNDSSSSLGLILGLTLSAAFLIVVIVLVCCYMKKKKEEHID